MDRAVVNNSKDFERLKKLRRTHLLYSFIKREIYNFHNGVLWGIYNPVACVDCNLKVRLSEHLPLPQQ